MAKHKVAFLKKFDLAFFKNLRRNPYLIAFLILLVLLPLLVFAVAAPVETGTKTMCRYNHLIEDDTRTILVWRWTADNYKVTTKKSLCDKHRELESLLRQAQAARDKKDFKRAQELVAEIKKGDPNFQVGNVAAIEAEVGTGTSGGSTTPGTTPGTTPDGSTPNYSGDLSGLFPASLAGYNLVNDSPGQLTASRMYSADNAVHPNVALLTVQFSRAGNTASVDNYINRYVKTYYTANARDLKVKGQNAYFGTDNADLAILAYPAGGVVVELEMSAADGNGASLYDILVELSNTVP